MVVEVGPEIEQLVFQICRRPDRAILALLIGCGLRRAELDILRTPVAFPVSFVTNDLDQ